jgi:hypothetical protein
MYGSQLVVDKQDRKPMAKADKPMYQHLGKTVRLLVSIPPKERAMYQREVIGVDKDGRSVTR